MEPRIVFEDGEIVACDKPAGQPSIPARGALPPALSSALERALGRKLFVVHRLDRDASGLIVFAKTAAAHARLCAAFAGRKASKSYLALVEGTVSAEGRVDSCLRQFGSGRMGIDERGKPSLTLYRPRRGGRGCSLLRASPVTGRRHQLRVHFWSIGHPILGDRLYGRPRPVGGAPRLMLHACSLSLEGLPPLACPPGEDFLEVLRGRGIEGNSNFF
ncbi:MAG: RNA pseudouridine synthase [Elusimicrobia bacterium]|nr:RNA pseudouridine synthase [Elusimicrobiota bacterium]MDE2238276.1 RNA pseudouridine synthase [Elusimicrobiota bacterium]MDE2425031.1 RNA pseudouridine synthase [Elusimicrobiota bacterium]